jgi:hypothetical protein
MAGLARADHEGDRPWISPMPGGPSRTTSDSAVTTSAILKWTIEFAWVFRP